MSEPEVVESPSPAEAGPVSSEKAEAQRMTEVWANERPNVVEELRESRKAAEPKPPPDPGKALLASAAEKLATYANAVTDQRDEARAERDAGDVSAWANHVVADYEAEPEMVALAADELRNTVGVDDPRFGQFIGEWQDSDPESAEAWMVGRMWANHYAMEEAAAQANDAQWQAYHEHQAALAKVAEEFVGDHADAGGRVGEIARLAAASGVDLGGDPAEVKVKLGVLYQAIRQLDPNAEPVRGAMRTGWDVSQAWGQAEADKVVNAGPLRGRSESMADFQERMNERGFDVDGRGRVHSRLDAEALVERASSQSAPGARVSPAEFEAAEQARLSAAWNLPTVAPAPDTRVDRSVREGEDPYWSYLAGYS